MARGRAWSRNTYADSRIASTRTAKLAAVVLNNVLPSGTMELPDVVDLPHEPLSLSIVSQIVSPCVK